MKDRPMAKDTGSVGETKVHKVHSEKINKSVPKLTKKIIQNNQ
jgi:hypothetical protein